jgi:hypothetical protein
MQNGACIGGLEMMERVEDGTEPNEVSGNRSRVHRSLVSLDSRVLPFQSLERRHVRVSVGEDESHRNARALELLLQGHNRATTTGAQVDHRRSARRA